MSAEISAKQNIGVDDLLDSILLTTEVEDLKADYKRDGLAIVLESHLDPQKGSIATVLVKTGTLKVGQDITAGAVWGRIRKMEDFRFRDITSAGPSTPVIIIGLNGTPNTNDIIQVASGKTAARAISQISKSAGGGKDNVINKNRIYNAIDEGKLKKLNVIIKSDVQGSLEAIEQILSTIKSDEVGIDYVGTGVGNITESDVKVAFTSKSLILGFNVNITPVAKRMAENDSVIVKTFNIIYELVEEVKKILIEMLPTEIIRTDIGNLKVLAIFKNGKHEMIVGGRVANGKITRGCLVEVKRDDTVIGKGKLANLQQNKMNADEVNQGNECGITFDGSTKIKEGDNLICYFEEEKKKTL